MEWVAFPFTRGSSQPRELRVPALQVDSLPAESQGKPKNTGVDSLSFLQQIFPTQELNWGLLHCRWILYQLSYQGSLIKVFSKSYLFYGKLYIHTYMCIYIYISSHHFYSAFPSHNHLSDDLFSSNCSLSSALFRLF